MNKGLLYLIPNTLGEGKLTDVLPEKVIEVIKNLNHFIVENEKTARRFIKKVDPEKKQSEIVFFILDKRSDSLEIKDYLNDADKGIDMGVLSEAGVPGVADPGALAVSLAHRKGIKVVPLVGPSSILMAMMASGMNGQSFTFNGYLPIEKTAFKKKLRQLENLSYTTSQLFIETPFRNNKTLDELLKNLSPETDLCIAADISLETEFIKTMPVKKWGKNKPDLHKRPALFIIEA